MRRFLRVSVTVLPACLGACVTGPSPQSVAPARHVFVARPARELGCAFEVFEEREPSRPYEVLGVLPISANEYVGKEGRKALLQDTACRAGADAVVLPRPFERMVAGRLQVREYEARFVVWKDSPPEEDAPALQR
ncbi:hypothetical protein LY474_20085 [Myxococcus stipitatus]|uniref:hypothetical protein n=1 Tax=Myxococcus stipitatus TaxID=83455 RepID=UPI001F20EF03|nr:hypothetical protein [Myxococcus stipitatus]MCE9670101.1 hypothetical protein [Myxococcus stipitatus]